METAIQNKTDNVRIRISGAFVQPLLEWKSNECYTTGLSVFSALVIQHAMRMRHFIICGLPALQYFSTISHKRHDFRKKVTE
jgi:hypothetical protein